MQNKGGYVYMMTNYGMGTLYVGVTSVLTTRVYQHKQGLFPDSFTDKHGLHSLVWYEFWPDMKEAIIREKQLKKWNRNWKLRLIIDMNPEWKDLWEDITVGNDY